MGERTEAFLTKACTRSPVTAGDAATAAIVLKPRRSTSVQASRFVVKCAVERRPTGKYGAKCMWFCTVSELGVVFPTQVAKVGVLSVEWCLYLDKLFGYQPCFACRGVIMGTQSHWWSDNCASKQMTGCSRRSVRGVKMSLHIKWRLS